MNSQMIGLKAKPAVPSINKVTLEVQDGVKERVANIVTKEQCACEKKESNGVGSNTDSEVTALKTKSAYSPIGTACASSDLRNTITTEEVCSAMEDATPEEVISSIENETIKNVCSTMKAPLGFKEHVSSPNVIQGTELSTDKAISDANEMPPGTISNSTIFHEDIITEPNVAINDDKKADMENEKSIRSEAGAIQNSSKSIRFVSDAELNNAADAIAASAVSEAVASFSETAACDQSETTTTSGHNSELNDLSSFANHRLEEDEMQIESGTEEKPIVSSTNLETASLNKAESGTSLSSSSASSQSSSNEDTKSQKEEIQSSVDDKENIHFDKKETNEAEQQRTNYMAKKEDGSEEQESQCLKVKETDQEGSLAKTSTENTDNEPKTSSHVEESNIHSQCVEQENKENIEETTKSKKESNGCCSIQ